MAVRRFPTAGRCPPSASYPVEVEDLDGGRPETVKGAARIVPQHWTPRVRGAPSPNPFCTARVPIGGLPTVRQRDAGHPVVLAYPAGHSER
jgi:hypothetical protein